MHKLMQIYTKGLNSMYQNSGATLGENLVHDHRHNVGVKYH